MKGSPLGGSPLGGSPLGGLLLIAGAEWRFWLRSRLALAVLAALAVLSAAAAATSVARLAAEADHRAAHQAEAHEAFLAQPDRHPHRMVHYGHYVFRLPAALAGVDPGLDAFTGNALFLEGHRQNSATFAGVRETALLLRFGDLTPAFVLQVAAPLLLLILGYASVARERESGALHALLLHGVSPGRLLLGKGLALASVATLALLPLAMAAGGAVGAGESPAAAGLLVLTYAGYLLAWVALVVLISAVARNRASSLAVLLVAWIALVLVIPRVGAVTAATVAPLAGAVETSLAMRDALRDAGDGHNAADVAFERFRTGVLAQYGVDSVEALPVNFRGLVAQESEARTSAVFNQFAEERRAGEQAQADVLRWFALLSPQLAVQQASMAVTGTDLATYHRFLRQAEDHRFGFVQFLNALHAEAVAYDADVNRSSDAAAEQRTRVSASNWQNLPEFEFAPAPAPERIRAALGALAVLGLWLGVLGAAWVPAARRLST